MDQQNFNGQDRYSLRPNEPVMESQALNLKRFFKALAVLIVFLISFSIPVVIAFNLEEQAKEMRIKMDMGQLKNWAEVYNLTNKSYEGFEKDPDLYRFFEDIELMDGEAKIFINQNYESYCSRVFFKRGSFCIDDTGHLGKDEGICSSEHTRCD